jgi:hypothetical protein
MRTTTRSAIRTDIRLYSDRPDVTNPTDAQLNLMIDRSWAKLWGIVINAEPSRYIQRADITITADTRDYDLPSDFFKLCGVAVADTSDADGYCILDKYEFDERYDYSWASDKHSTRYSVDDINGKITFHPVPNWAGTVRIEYIPYAEEWDDSTTINTVNGWDEWIIYDVCASLLALDQEDPSYFISQRNDVEIRILKTAEINVGDPPVVIDYRRSGRKGWYGY